MANSKKQQVEDIFAEVDKPNAKKIKTPPKNNQVKLREDYSKSSVVPKESVNSNTKLKGPMKILIAFVVVVILGIAYIFISGFLGNNLDSSIATDISANKVEDESSTSVNNNGKDNSVSNEINTATLNVNKGPSDKDGDGLSDEEEKRIGTSLVNSDTDGDGLFDREEVEVYKTNPKLKDTDGDGRDDGVEVANGYNPNGPGLLLDLQKSIDNL